MTVTTLVNQPVSQNRKYIAGFVFLIAFALLFQILHLVFSGKTVEVVQLFIMLAMDALLFSVGVFLLIKRMLHALLISFCVLFVFLVPFTLLFLFSLFRYDLFPGSENTRRFKILETDGVLNCPVAGSTFKQAEHSNDLFNSPGHRNAFDGGDTPSQVTRILDLNGADPNKELTTFSKCAQENGWTVTPVTTTYNGNLTHRATKTFSDGWTATMDISPNMHPTDYKGNDTRSPYIWFHIETDYVSE